MFIFGSIASYAGVFSVVTPPPPLPPPKKKKKSAQRETKQKVIIPMIIYRKNDSKRSYPLTYILQFDFPF